jgi:hypothetical protein
MQQNTHTPAEKPGVKYVPVNLPLKAGLQFEFKFKDRCQVHSRWFESDSSTSIACFIPGSESVNMTVGSTWRYEAKTCCKKIIPQNKYKGVPHPKGNFELLKRPTKRVDVLMQQKWHCHDIGFPLLIHARHKPQFKCTSARIELRMITTVSFT